MVGLRVLKFIDMNKILSIRENFPKKLTNGDTGEFFIEYKNGDVLTIPGVVYGDTRLGAGCFVNFQKLPNSFIFDELNVNRYSFIKKYLNLSPRSGGWPEMDNLGDLRKVIDLLVCYSEL